MRVLAYFLTAYLLFLALAPCGDREECRPDLSFYTSFVDLTHDTANEHGPETCTPLCSCNCCSVSLIRTLPQAAQQVKQVSFKVQAEYRLPVALKTPDFIWEPPRIS